MKTGRPLVDPVVVTPCRQCGYLTANKGKTCTKCLDSNASKRSASYAVRLMLPADHPLRRGTSS
jgi:hypothetical protein